VVRSPVPDFQEDRGGSKKALRFSLLDLGSRGAGEAGAAGGFEEDCVGAGGQFRIGAGVVVKFPVDLDFCAVGFGSDSELTVTVRRRLRGLSRADSSGGVAELSC
jgi:hypothetical protein